MDTDTGLEHTTLFYKQEGVIKPDHYWDHPELFYTKCHENKRKPNGERATWSQGPLYWMPLTVNGFYLNEINRDILLLGNTLFNFENDILLDDKHDYNGNTRFI